MKKSKSRPKGKAIALVFYVKRSILKLIGFECKMNYDEDEPRSDRNVDSRPTNRSNRARSGLRVRLWPWYMDQT